MKDLKARTTPRRVGEGSYRWDVADGWQQGRGAFGGVVIAAMIRAALAERDDNTQPLRALTATLCAPVVVEPAEVSVELLRAGNNTTTLVARVTQADEVRAHATALFGRRRVADGDWSRLEAPDIGDWRGADVASLPEPLAPRFAQHFEYRPREGFPFTGGQEAKVCGWIRPRRPGEQRDAAYLAACMDAYWPAPFATFDRPRPMATISFSMEFLGGWDGLDADAPLFYRSNSPVASDGYAAEFRELWGHDGRLMALNQQTFCIIK